MTREYYEMQFYQNVGFAAKQMDIVHITDHEILGNWEAT